MSYSISVQLMYRGFTFGNVLLWPQLLMKTWVPKQNIAVWEQPIQYKLCAAKIHFFHNFILVFCLEIHLITQWDILPIFASFSNFGRETVFWSCTLTVNTVFLSILEKTKKVYIYILQKPWYFLTQNEAKMVKIFYHKVMQKQQLQKKKILQFFFSTTEVANPTNRKKIIFFLKNKK